MIIELSRTGARHSRGGQENQDAVFSGRQGHYTVISLADGVSACGAAKAGAETACAAVTGLLLKRGAFFLEFEGEKAAQLIISHVAYELERRALADGRRVEEYSSTLASVLYDGKSGKLLYFSLGDSMILAVDHGRCRVLAAPSDSTRGCCVTTTKNASAMARTGILDADGMESVLICSDGAWRELFRGNRLKPEAASLLAGHEVQGLKEYLARREQEDDCTLILMDLRRERRRRSA